MFFNYSIIDKKYHSINHFENAAHHFYTDTQLQDIYGEFILYVGF